MVGRPKQFEKEEALEKAMQVFWTKGYEAASVQDLLDGMGINRGSMYATFGDKHALFLKAVDHYRCQARSRMVETTSAPGCRGCLMTNTAVEMARHDGEVAAVLRNFLGDAEKAFHGALKRAVKAGELVPSTDTKALARFFSNTLNGMVVMGKASMGRTALSDIAKVATGMLEQA